MSDLRVPEQRVSAEWVDQETGQKVVRLRVSSAESRAAQMAVRRMRARGETPSKALIAVANARPAVVGQTDR